MFYKNNDISAAAQKKELVVITFVYLIFAFIFGYSYIYSVDYLGPDTVSYLRLAEHIAEGNFQQSVTSWWAPFITWCLVPFLFLGVDGLIATSIVTALSGLGLVFTSRLLADRFIESHNNRFIVVLISVLIISHWTKPYQGLTPDILFSALIIFYFYIVTNPDILDGKMKAILCGSVAGFAYLTKHYAFPFFAVHYPLTLLLRGYIDRDGNTAFFKKAFVPWIVGMLAFLVISSPWIITLSVKEHKLTMGSPGKANYALLGPEHPVYSPFIYANPSFRGLHKPQDRHVFHTWEDPSGMEYGGWSPFESKENFYHQLRLIKRNFRTVFIKLMVRDDSFISQSFFFWMLPLVPLGFLIKPLTKKRKFLYGFTLLTIMVYPSGYMLTLAYSIRYFYPVLIVFILISFHFFESLQQYFHDIKKEILHGWRKKLLASYVVIVFILTFTLNPGMNLFSSMKNMFVTPKTNQFRKAADQLNHIKFPEPYAIVGLSQTYVDDMFNLFVAYYLKRQFVGRPLSTDLEGITTELKASDAKSLVIFDNLELSIEFKNDGRYIHQANISKDEIAGSGKEINIFILKSKDVPISTK